jgi:hypothetical protein
MPWPPLRAHDVEEPVFKIHLCLLLRDSLDDAFRGENRGGPDWLSNWGHVTASLVHRNYPDRPEARAAVWHAMRKVLWDLASTHSCEELSRHILLHPETFLATVLMLGAPGPPKTESHPQHPPTVH